MLLGLGLSPPPELTTLWLVLLASHRSCNSLSFKWNLSLRWGSEYWPQQVFTSALPWGYPHTYETPSHLKIATISHKYWKQLAPSCRISRTASNDKLILSSASIRELRAIQSSCHQRGKINRHAMLCDWNYIIRNAIGYIPVENSHKDGLCRNCD